MEYFTTKNQVYFDEYSGQYCYDCENFYTEIQAPNKHCPHHGVPLTEKRENGYFFKLSEHREWLIAYINQHPKFIVPRSAEKEILSRLEGEEGLRDLAISRPKEEEWGIAVPGNDAFVMYTWFDAVINYYSALDPKQREKFWPANCHVIGKDIVWFHTVIWPSILRACELPLPQTVYVHGMVLGADGQKMSKTLGNVVDPQDVIERYPIDSFRYYILRAISSSSDGRFSEKDLQERHNTELSNEFGNLIFRVVKFALKQGIETLSGQNVEQELCFKNMAEKFSQHVENYEHNRAIDCLWESVRKTNQYLNEKGPWRVKDKPEQLHSILYNCLHAIHVFCFYLAPVMPEKAKEAARYLGGELDHNPVGHFGQTIFQLQMPEVLFAKFAPPAPSSPPSS